MGIILSRFAFASDVLPGDGASNVDTTASSLSRSKFQLRFRRGDRGLLPPFSTEEEVYVTGREEEEKEGKLVFRPMILSNSTRRNHHHRDDNDNVDADDDDDDDDAMDDTLSKSTDSSGGSPSSSDLNNNLDCDGLFDSNNKGNNKTKKNLRRILFPRPSKYIMPNTNLQQVNNHQHPPSVTANNDYYGRQSNHTAVARHYRRHHVRDNMDVVRHRGSVINQRSSILSSGVGGDCDFGRTKTQTDSIRMVIRRGRGRNNKMREAATTSGSDTDDEATEESLKRLYDMRTWDMYFRITESRKKSVSSSSTTVTTAVNHFDCGTSQPLSRSCIIHHDTFPSTDNVIIAHSGQLEIVSDHELIFGDLD